MKKLNKKKQQNDRIKDMGGDLLTLPKKVKRQQNLLNKAFSFEDFDEVDDLLKNS
jgi:hypothetical protein